MKDIFIVLQSLVICFGNVTKTMAQLEPSVPYFNGSLPFFCPCNYNHTTDKSPDVRNSENTPTINKQIAF